MKSLGALLPAIYTEADQNDGSLGVFVGAYDQVQTEIEEAIVDLKEVNLPQETDGFIQDCATRYGNPFPFMTDARWENQDTVDQLTTIYGLRGTEVGVMQAALLLCKIPVTVVQDLEYAWVLGESTLGAPIS